MDQSVATITQDYVLLQIITGFAEDGVDDRVAGAGTAAAAERIRSAPGTFARTARNCWRRKRDGWQLGPPGTAGNVRSARKAHLCCVPASAASRFAV